MLDFVKENAVLIGLAFGSGIALLMPTIGRGASGVPNVSATEAVMLLSRNKPLVLDVRDAAEFAAGHIQGAVHIPVAELAGRIKEIEKFKDKPVLINCQKGIRSKTACTILKAQAFTQLHNLEGGLDTWVAANLPLIKTKA
jgi:rhodanese-related sulfurtransferase